MGHLISRAFRRLTQNSSSQSSTRSQQAEQQTENNDTQDVYHNPTGRPVTESIPVGQSIDSAEYAGLKNSKNEGKEGEIAQGDAEEKQAITSEEPNKSPGVEEAVIKIQALVRGHLTRKALKDSHNHSVPSPNALGQNQFDEESLIKNPLSAVFLTPSPLSLEGDINQQQQHYNATHTSEQTPSRTPLDSIAESTETVTAAQANTTTSVTTITTAPAARTQLVQEQRINEDRKKLAKLNTRSATSPSKLETPPVQYSRSPDSREQSSSPVPSEANASIDLNTCDTPASASIDISDHNIKPTDKIASVLHPKEDENRLTSLNEQLSRVPEVPTDADGEQQKKQEPHQSLETPDSLLDNGEEEEAAAIRIQSAFRGYRTRKNSPYRTRSPTTLSANKQQEAQSNQQESTIHDKNEEPRLVDHAAPREEEMDNFNQGQNVSDTSQSRRSSRARQRDGDEQQKVSSLDEFTITDEADATTVKETLPVQAQQQQQQHSSCLSDTIESAEGSVKKSLLTPKSSQMDYNTTTNNNNNNRDQTTTTSLSLDGADLTDANVSELDTTEAGVVSTGLGAQSIGNSADAPLIDPRSSLAGKSEASLETLDTDSSFLGAALSLNGNENENEIENENENDDLSEAQATATNTSSTAQLEPIDEDKSLGASLMIRELEAEARKLVDDMTRDLTGESSTDQGGALVEEAANLYEETVVARDDQQLKQDDIKVTTSTNSVSLAKNEGDHKVLAMLLTLSEEEQRAIELESDEIERRDPRGQVSEERVKSPQIITEQPQFGGSALDEQKDSLADELVIASASTTEQQEVQPTVLGEATTDDNHAPDSIDNSSSNNNNLTVESSLQQQQQQQKSEGRDSANVSGRSSPAFNSSSAPSSSDGDDDDEEEADELRNQEQLATSSQSVSPNKRQQQQSGGSGTTSRNKKRNNRNKRKSKK